MKRIETFFKTNTSLKFLSLLFAVMVWLVIVNYDNPVITRTISGIPIEIINDDTITENDMIYSVSGQPTATVKVRCSRKLAESLKVADFRAVADFNHLYEMTNQVPVTITCSNMRITSDDMTPVTHSLEITLEKVETKTMDVQVVMTGEPASGYRVGDYSCSPTSIRVSAPQSFLDQISFAGVQVDVSGISQTLNQKVEVQFFSAGGNPLDTSDVAVLSVSQEKIDVEIEILNVKTVNINYAVSGQDQVADGYMYAGIELEPSTVQISGRKTALAEVSALTIPVGELNIAGADGNIVRTFDMSDLLPEGVELIDPENDTLTVTIKIEKLGTKEYTLPVAQLTVKNLQEDLVITNGDTEITFSVQGLEADLDELRLAELSGSIDLEGLSEGGHLVYADISVPHGFSVVNRPGVVVVLEKEEPETTTAAEEPETTPVETDPITGLVTTDDPGEEIPEVSTAETESAPDQEEATGDEE